MSKRLFVPYILRGPLTDLRQTWWVYVGWPPICPWGVLFRKGQRLDGSMGHFRFPLYYICASLTPHAAMAPFAWQAAESNSAPFAVLHVNGVCRWTSQLLLRGSFSKRLTGQRVTFTILYMIADDTRLTPPRCKKHTGSTGWRVNGSTGQTGQTGHFHFHYIIYDSRRCQAHATLLQKSTRRMMTPGSHHTAAKSTQRLLLARRVNFLVWRNSNSNRLLQHIK